MNEQQQKIHENFITLPQEQQWKILDVLAASDQDMLERTISSAWKALPLKDQVITRIKRGYMLGFKTCSICNWAQYLAWSMAYDMIVYSNGCDCVPSQKHYAVHEKTEQEIEEMVNRNPELAERWATAEGFPWPDNPQRMFISHDGVWAP